MWVLKVKGETYYVSHVEVKPNVGFCTKETEDNPHTKGALKFKASMKIFTNKDDKAEAIIY